MVTAIKRGDTWAIQWLLLDANEQPINLTGASARVHLRDRRDALIVEATQANGRIQIIADEGKIIMEVPYDLMEIPIGCYYWDLEVTSAAGDRWTVDEGQLNVQMDHSHD